MSRRRSKNDGSGASFALIIALFALGFILYVLSVMITVAFYAFPLIVLAAYLYIKTRTVEFPEIPNPATFDSPEVSKQIKHLIVERAKLIADIDNSYAIGEQKGLYLTKASGETRFDIRSKLGRELNRQIDLDEEQAAALAFMIDTKRHDVAKNFPFHAWQLAYGEWKTWQDAYVSLVDALRFFLVSAALCYLVALVYADKFWMLQKVIAWHPFPNILVSPLLISMVVALIAFPLRLRRHGSQISGPLDAAALDQWSELSSKWIGPDFEGHFTEGFGATGAQHWESAPEESGGWHQVLNVEPSASPDEIKSAYRAAIKNYHPDRVSGLGSKLQEVAENETKRLNAAYQAARSERGF